MLKKIFNRSDNSIIIVRKPIKHLYLRVQGDGQLLVSAPKHLPMKTIQAFITSKQEWIAKKQHQLAKRKNLLTIDQQPPDELILFGKNYPIIYRLGENTYNKLYLDKQTIYIELKHSKTSSTNQIISTFHRQQLQTVLNEQVKHYQAIIGVNVNEIRIKQMKTKWGSCNISDKRLWFNLKLSQLPLQCSEYVVVHEMTHLLERYHNHRFYTLVEKAMPNWAVWHRYLKQS